MRKNKSQQNHRLSLSKIFALVVIASTVIIAGLTRTAYGQLFDNPGYNWDSQIYNQWDCNINAGTCIYDITNIGSETKTDFWWPFRSITNATVDTGWVYNWTNDIFYLYGQTDKLNPTETTQVRLFFDPNNSYFAIDDFFHSGDLTQGNFKIGVINVVPEPISSILFLSGGAVLTFRRFIKRKRVHT